MPPRAIWYLLPVTMFVVAIVLFVVAVSTIAHLVNGDLNRVATTPDPSAAGQVTGLVSVPDSGRTIWTQTKSSDAACVVQPSGGGQPVELDTFPFEFEFPHGGRSYYAVGVTPKDTAAGSYRLVCSDTVDGERFAMGPRIDTTALATRFIWGIGLPIVLVLAGLIILIVMIVRRHGAKVRVRDMQRYPGSGYGAAWNQAYPPGSGSTPPPPPPPPAADTASSPAERASSPAETTAEPSGTPPAPPSAPPTTPSPPSSG